MYLYSMLIILVSLLSTLVEVQGTSDFICQSCNTAKCEDPTNCKGGKTLDMCGCCQECALVKGDRCGGQSGVVGGCDRGLVCKKEKIFIKEAGLYETEYYCRATPCIDKAIYRNNCSRWARKGECTTNGKWMWNNCCKSCRPNSKGRSTCFDIKQHQSECPGWAAKDQCKINYKWMWENCCKSCQSGSAKSCTDTMSKCAGWAAKGECKKNKGWMSNNCCASCKNN